LLSPLKGDADQAAAETVREQGGAVIAAPGPDHDAAGVAAADVFVVHHCQLLLASAGDRRDETSASNVSRWQLEGLPPEMAPRRGSLDPPEIGPMVRLSADIANEAANSSSSQAPFQVIWPATFSIAQKHLQLERVFRPFDGLNRDLQRFSEEVEVEPSSSDKLWENTSPSALSLHKRFETLDWLAARFQRHSMRSVTLILVFAAVGALALNLRIVLPRVAALLLWTYAAALAAAYLVYLWAKHGDFHNKYLDYRALAEGLRVQAFWRLAGVQACAADFYLQRQKGELAWIRQALRNWFLVDCLQESAEGQTPAAEQRGRLELVFQHWIKDQRWFFEHSAKRRDQTARRLGLTARTTFRLGLALAALNAVIAPPASLLLLAGMAPVGAALIHLYSRHRALAEDARRYSSMSLIWAGAETAFARALNDGDLNECSEIVRELGHETLAENGEWILLHRQRPLEVPTIK
jgi:hypothetical protein